jgi:hypothetical protein
MEDLTAWVLELAARVSRRGARRGVGLLAQLSIGEHPYHRAVSATSGPQRTSEEQQYCDTICTHLRSAGGACRSRSPHRKARAH